MINWINRTREKPLIFLQNGSSFNTKYSKYSNVECLRNLITYSSLSRRIIKWRDEVATTSPKTPTFDREWNALRERIFATVDGFWVEINPRIFQNSHGTQFRNFISRILDESSSSLPANYSQWYVIIGRGSNCIAQSMLLNRLAEWLASDFERNVVNIHFYSPPFHRVFLVCLFFSSYTGCS